jgi:hypothetical protein
MSKKQLHAQILQVYTAQLLQVGQLQGYRSDPCAHGTEATSADELACEGDAVNVLTVVLLKVSIQSIYCEYSYRVWDRRSCAVADDLWDWKSSSQQLCVLS